MDLGLGGKSAIICASSRGLGRACAQALLQEGVRVFLNGRNRDRLDIAARDLLETTGGVVIPVVGDVTTAPGRNALLAACPDPDILINNNAGPAPQAFEDIDEATWVSTLERRMMAWFGRHMASVSQRGTLS